MIRRRGMKAGIVLETLIILIGLGLLIKGCMIGATTYRFIHAMPKTEGTIVNSGNYGFTRSIQLDASGQGAVFYQNGLFFGLNTGDHVSAYYDPANPSHAAVENFTALWFDTAIRGLGGLLLLAFGFRLRASRSV